MNPAILIPLLQMLPGLVENGLKIARALRESKDLPADARARLAEVEARLVAIVKDVREVPLPERRDG